VYINDKPLYCQEECQYSGVGGGFVQDTSNSPDPFIAAVVAEAPGQEEVVQGTPLVGKAGRLLQALAKLAGVNWDRILRCNVLRCRPPANVYPTGELRTAAEKTCRHWDGQLNYFNPNIWGVTFHPAEVFRSPREKKFILAALVRLQEHIEAGDRPCLLLGVKAMNQFAPWLSGGMKRWQNHWWHNE
jgi:hypothetical protein